MAPGKTFPRSARILRKSEFDRVFQHVERRLSGFPFLLLISTGQGAAARLGLVVGKRHIRTAARRNWVKRICRECFRNRRESLPALDILILCRNPSPKDTRATLTERLDSLLAELEKPLQARSA